MPNLKGAQRAIASGVNDLVFVLSANEEEYMTMVLQNLLMKKISNYNI